VILWRWKNYATSCRLPPHKSITPGTSPLEEPTAEAPVATGEPTPDTSPEERVVEVLDGLKEQTPKVNSRN